MPEITAKQMAQAKKVFLQCTLLHGIEPAAAEKIFCAAVLNCRAKGEQLCVKQNLCFLLAGKAKVYTQNGSVVMRNIEPGAFFGAASLFCTQNVQSSVIAAERCIIACLSEKTVRRLLESCAPFCHNYICFLSDRIRFLNRKICSFTGADTEERVLHTLRSFADTNGKVLLPCSMGELANRLNISRSSLYRAIDSLIASNKIEKNKYICIKGELL